MTQGGMKMAYNRHSKKTLLAFLTALSISLGASGCTNTNINNKESKKEVSAQADNLATTTPSPTLTPEEVEKIELENLITEYLNYFSTIDVEYPNEKFYPSKKEIDKILTMDSTYQEYKHDDSITMKQLYTIIKKNSIQYVKKHPEFQNPFSDDRTLSLKDYITNSYFQGALELLLRDLKKNSTNDFLEDICRMKTLKIVFGSLNKTYIDNITSARYIPKKNLIILDKKAIKKMDKKRKYDILEDKDQDVLKHELSHLRDHACKHKLKKGQKFKEILGGNSALMESSSESSTYALDEFGYYEIEHADFAYINEREDESLILLLGLFNNKTYSDYYNAISDSNPYAFYEFCGMKSKEEKYKLYKILAAIDGRNFRNTIAFEVKKAKKISMADAQKSIRYNYRLDIFHNVLSSMVDYTANHPDFTIEENLQMLNMVENCILDDTLYLNQKNSFDQQFIVDIYQSETKYIDFLSQYYFNGEKDSTVIKENYIEDYTDFKVFEKCIDDIAYSNDLLEEFPLLRPILFAHDAATFSHEDFLEENGNFIKQKCKTKEIIK